MQRIQLVAALVALAAAAIPVAAAGGGTPAAGTQAADVELRSVAGAVPHGDGWAIPLKGSTPDWYTAEPVSYTHLRAHET